MNKLERNEAQITSDVVVLSIICGQETGTEGQKTKNTYKHSTSDCIIDSIANIRRNFARITTLMESAPASPLPCRDLAPELRTQQIAFENTGKTLLLMVSRSPQDVENMFEYQAHPIWTDVTAHRRLSVLMARSCHLCEEALKGFSRILCEILREYQTGKKQIKKKNWFRREVSKTLVVDRIEPLHRLFDDLRSYGDFFRTIVRHTARGRPGYVDEPTKVEDLQDPRHKADLRTFSGYFEILQQMSGTLYGTLSKAWTCRQEEVHSISISTDVVAYNSGFRFGLAVTTSHLDRPLHFLVGATRDKTGTHKIAEEIVKDVSPYLNSAGTTDDSQWHAKLPVTAGMHPDRLVTDQTSQSVSALSCSWPIRNHFRNLNMEQNLCSYLQESCAAIEMSKTSEYPCLGYLESDDGVTFLIFYTLKGRYAYSLDDVLERAGTDCNTISVKQRLVLASLLATAVISFYDTPWPPRVWSSQNIQFFNTDAANTKRTLVEPYLKTLLDQDTTAHETCLSKDVDSRRFLLLSFGIILIEIANSAPWRKLQSQEDITKDLNKRDRNVLNLMRLSEIVSRELGSRYAKVVQKCLEASVGDPGPGNHTEGLSEIDFQEDVIKQLNECVLAVSDHSSTCGMAIKVPASSNRNDLICT
ncbi:MAG: hypothetical protein Q9195_007943 [Heterodermia aff. obscurata]